MTTLFYLAVSCRLACGGRGERDRRCYYDHLLRPPLWWRLHRMDGSCCWLSQETLAMPTMLYYVAVSGAKLPTVPDWSDTKTRHGEKWPCTHRSPPGQLAWRERHRQSTCCCYGTPLLPGCSRIYVCV